MGREHHLFDNPAVQPGSRLHIPDADILAPFRVVMSLADGKERTELTVQRVEYNLPIDDATFNKEALR